MSPQPPASVLSKALQQISAARLLFAEGDYDNAAGRAYYAMYHAATQLLNSFGQSYSSHGAVHAAIGRDFAKTGRLPKHLHRALINAFEARIAGDYSPEPSLQREAAEITIRDAEEFLSAITSLLAGTAPLDSEPDRIAPDQTSPDPTDDPPA